MKIVLPDGEACTHPLSEESLATRRLRSSLSPGTLLGREDLRRHESGAPHITVTRKTMALMGLRHMALGGSPPGPLFANSSPKQLPLKSCYTIITN